MKSIHLQNYPFYNELDSKTIDFLRKNLKPISLKEDNILFYQGDICDSILFLTNGIVRLYIQSDGTDGITLYQLKKGEQCIVNTASTISQTAAIGSAVTVTDIEGYLLDVKSVKELEKNPKSYSHEDSSKFYKLCNISYRHKAPPYLTIRLS